MSNQTESIALVHQKLNFLKFLLKVVDFHANGNQGHE